MKIIYFLLIILMLTNCSPLITRTYQTNNQVVQNLSDCKPEIIKNKDLNGLPIQFKGSIRIAESGFSVNCSEEKIREKLMDEACFIDANLINITQEAFPNLMSTCYQCIADFYYIQFDSVTSKVIQMPDRYIVKYDERNLEWSDFQNNLSDSVEVPYGLVTSIKIKDGDLSFWNGAVKRIEAEGIFYGDVSFAKTSFKTKANLDHIRVLFDLAQIYAKRFEQHINNQSGTTNIKKFQEIREKYVLEMFEEQRRYIDETNYGLNKSIQQKWINTVESELTTYSKIN